MPDDVRGYSPLFPLTQRQPPSNIQAEQALLGAILRNNKALDRVAEFLEPAHFADPVNGRIYAECRRLIAGGRLADAVTLKSVLAGAGILDEVGGTAYLAELLTAMVGIINAGDYGHAVHDAWIRRQIIEICEEGVNGAFGADPERDGRAVLDGLNEAGLALAQASSVGTVRETRFGDAVQRVAGDQPQTAIQGLMTGIASLDAVWRGLWPGTLDILAGRPGAGKTALALQIAGNVARSLLGADGHPSGSVGFWSMEMPADQLAARAVSMETGISTDDLREGRAAHRAADIIRAQRAWFDLPVLIYDEPRRTLAQFSTQARVAHRRHKLRLAIVDHAAKFRRDRSQQRMTETEFLSTVASDCHDVALDLGIPVLLLWHMSRDGDRRDDPRPRLSDLKYAGEGDADNVVLLWRKERTLGGPPERPGGMSEERFAPILAKWNNDREKWSGRAEAVFAKRRSGPEGAVMLAFDGVRTRFSDLPEPQTGIPDMWGFAESEAQYG